MLERTFVISNRLGLHARATAKLVHLLSGYRSEVTLAAKGREVNAKSIMGVMLLAAGQGTHVTIRIDGDDSADAMQAVDALFASHFDEEN